MAIAIGMGTASPGTTSDLHVLRSTGNAALRLQTTAADAADWIFRAQDNGQFQFRDNASGTIPFRLGKGANSNLLNVGMDATGATTVANAVRAPMPGLLRNA